MMRTGMSPTFMEFATQQGDRKQHRAKSELNRKGATLDDVIRAGLMEEVPFKVSYKV
jgi:hypothetical protein